MQSIFLHSPPLHSLFCARSLASVAKASSCYFPAYTSPPLTPDFNLVLAGWAQGAASINRALWCMAPGTGDVWGSSVASSAMRCTLPSRLGPLPRQLAGVGRQWLLLSLKAIASQGWQRAQSCSQRASTTGESIGDSLHSYCLTIPMLTHAVLPEVLMLWLVRLPCQSPPSQPDGEGDSLHG